MSTQINIDTSMDQGRNHMKNIVASKPDRKGKSRQLGVLDERKEEDESEGDDQVRIGGGTINMEEEKK